MADFSAACKTHKATWQFIHVRLNKTFDYLAHTFKTYYINS